MAQRGSPGIPAWSWGFPARRPHAALNGRRGGGWRRSRRKREMAGTAALGRHGGTAVLLCPRVGLAHGLEVCAGEVLPAGVAEDRAAADLHAVAVHADHQLAATRAPD